MRSGGDAEEGVMLGAERAEFFGVVDICRNFFTDVIFFSIFVRIIFTKKYGHVNKICCQEL